MVLDYQEPQLWKKKNFNFTQWELFSELEKMQRWKITNFLVSFPPSICGCYYNLHPLSYLNQWYCMHVLGLGVLVATGLEHHTRLFYPQPQPAASPVGSTDVIICDLSSRYWVCSGDSVPHTALVGANTVSSTVKRLFFFFKYYSELFKVSCRSAVPAEKTGFHGLILCHGS